MRFILFSFLIVALGGACSNDNKDETHRNSRQKPIKTAPKIDRTESLDWPNNENSDQFLLAYGEKNQETEVVLSTRLGDIKIKLFKDTPFHRANFLFNIKRGLYKNTIFYRVIPQFMVQGGNSDDDETKAKRSLNGSFYIPNETNNAHFHKRGAVAMTMTYENNPNRRSAQYSFYIVTGKKFDADLLAATEKEYGIQLNQEQKAYYISEGGTPHLDGIHTVFGEVTEGMEVVEAISQEQTDSGDWPVNDIFIDYKILK